MDWNESSISFYVDGQLVGSKPTPSDMHGPMYLLVNLATQNDPNNNADVSNVPISANIDYIRVYSHLPPPSDTPGSDATIGSGPDQLLLAISEDAYDGDAQYQVLVDGTSVEFKRHTLPMGRGSQITFWYKVTGAAERMM